MFERYLSDALTTHFGHFVENLDADKVRISAWNGELILKDLYLRRDALEQALGEDCPVEIEYGKVGNLELRIPWSLVRSQLRWRSADTLADLGCTIILSDVNILITPKRSMASKAPEPDNRSHDTNLSVEERRIRKEQEVQRKTDAVLFRRVAAQLQSSRSEKLQTSKTSARPWEWARRLATSIVSSLGVTIQNIHVRYEDPGSCLGFVWSDRNAIRERNSFAIGVTLRQFSVQATGDVEKEAERATDKFSVRQKLAAAYQLAMYWDRGCELLASDVPESHIPKSWFSRRFEALNLEDETQHCHLLYPVSPSLHFSLIGTKQDDVDSSTHSRDSQPHGSLTPPPPSSAIVSLPPCRFEVSRYALEDAAYLRKSLAIWKQTRKGLVPHNVLQTIARLRPSVSPINNPEGWWRYAFEATTILLRTSRGEDTSRVGNASFKRKRGWIGLSDALAARKRYINFYVTILTSSNETEREDAHLTLLRMEDTLTDVEIFAFRMSVGRSPLLVRKHGEAGLQSLSPNDGDMRLELFDEGSDAIMKHASLSIDQRCRKFEEMVHVLRQDMEGDLMSSQESMDGRSSGGGAGVDLPLDMVVWRSELICPVLSLQLNEKSSGAHAGAPSGGLRRGKPVVKVSCAVQQQQKVFVDGGWEVDCAIASLDVKDLTTKVSESRSAYSPHLFPYLVNTMGEESPESSDTILIGGLTERLSASINVRRSFSSNDDSFLHGSTTWTRMRLYPLEIVYATNPVAALSRVFSSIQTPELTNDYHRLASIALRWREKQRRRLVQALAHRRKRIIVDVDVSAPVILIPEDMQSKVCPLLVIDLGHLKFSNAGQQDAHDFDDRWILSLNDIQVQSSSTAWYRISKNAGTSLSGVQGSIHQMVEPFSLQFVISSRFAASESHAVDSRGSTKVTISAVLPRLVFNLTSSAVRLVKRLERKWERRRSSSLDRSFINGMNMKRSEDSPLSEGKTSATRAERTVEFKFSAPLIALRLENDVDGQEFLSVASGESDRHCGSSPATPLVDIALSGIRGTFVQKVDVSGAFSTTLDAKLHSVQAIDLYQQAGKKYCHLVSSFVPDMNRHLSSDLESFAELQEEIESDLVSVRFVTCTADVDKWAEAASFSEVSITDTLLIRFNELYVEWNPETLAAVHKAMQLPTRDRAETSYAQDLSEQENEDESDSNDEFFDALEYDDSTDSPLSFERNDSDNHFPLISEISSSRASSFSDAAEVFAEGMGSDWKESIPLSPLWLRRGTMHAGGMPEAHSVLRSSGYMTQDIGLEKPSAVIRRFRVVFELMKLRVNFNKESRHRRLVTAEMDRTNLEYTSKCEGGSKTVARIGNLSISDAASADNSTLYGEVLGLKSDSFAKSVSTTSVLELELTMNEKTRTFWSTESSPSEEPKGVSVNLDNGTIVGCDFSLVLRFSPMRFVYLQQLWFEIADYFFEGIIGYEVWGRLRPQSIYRVDQQDTSPLSREEGQPLRRDLQGASGESIGFTSFQITMEAPTIVVPVTYRSPTFLRLDFSTLTVSNHYTAHVISTMEGVERVQWFNNCVASLRHLRVSNWQGVDLTKSGSPDPADDAVQYTNAHFSLNWPTGPGASSITPKWDVSSEVDALSLFLRKDDYALLQHVVSFNVAEPSRHLEEWNALQNLPPPDLENYKKRIMVHFGYDKKDVTPTTYSISLHTPSLSFVLTSSEGGEEEIARAQCGPVEWRMRKGVDQIVRQHVTCDAALRGGRQGVDLLLPSKFSSNDMRGAGSEGFPEGVLPTGTGPMLLYMSTTGPSGNNVKSLQITEGTIYFIYPAWISLMRFFGSLGQPEMMDSEEIQNSIQIGDRWYPMGRPENEARRIPKRKRSLGGALTVPKTRRAATYQFRLLLTSPCITLSCGEFGKSRTSVILRMTHFDFLHKSEDCGFQTSKTFFVHGVEVSTFSGNSDCDSTKYSLIHPWNATGIISHTSGSADIRCIEHRATISADVMRARAAYSDMSQAIDVGLHYFSEFRKPSMVKDSRKVETVDSEPEEGETQSLSASPQTDSLVMSCRGFELTVIDDSLRHFANAQELISLCVGSVSFTRITRSEKEAAKGPSIGSDSAKNHDMSLCIAQIDLFDRLQPARSPFRLAATSRSADESSPAMAGEISASSASSNEMLWSDFCSTEQTWGYGVAHSLAEMAVSPQAMPDRRNDRGLVELRSSVSGGAVRQIEARTHSFTLKWNPSTVIALQRFLGRLLKEAKSKSADSDDPVLMLTPSVSKDSASRDDSTPSQAARVPLRVTCSVEDLTVCLNKEHQDRMLLRVEMLGNRVSFETNTNGGMTIAGSIRDVNAWDSDEYERLSRSILPANRRVFCVLREAVGSEPPGSSAAAETFFKFHYRTFSKKEQMNRASFPAWVESLLADSKYKTVDDYLSITVASLRFNYIRERAEEILDYLSNGLPGKGMGATSRAAKGFIERRIQTKSFLDLSIHMPQVQVPKDETADCGIVIRLGDVKLRSWFEAGEPSSRGTVPSELDDSRIVWSRALSLTLKGMGWTTYLTLSADSPDELTSCMIPVDLCVALRKPRTQNEAMAVRGNLSSVETTLNYTAYTLIRAILKRNIGRKVDSSLWDNVEKAYWMQEATAETSTEADETHIDDDGSMAYSSSARIITYGKKQQLAKSKAAETSDQENEPGKSRSNIDLTFDLAGLSLKLRRDDCLDLEGAILNQSLVDKFSYDMILFRVEKIQINAGKDVNGDTSIHLSLFRIGLFDLGDMGRLARERFYENLGRSEVPKSTRPPSAFVVIAEGRSESEAEDSATPHLVVTVDTCPSSSAGWIGESNHIAESCDRMTVVRVMVNNLTVNALIRPIREIGAFVDCSWPTDYVDNGTHRPSFESRQHRVEDTEALALNQKENMKTIGSDTSGFQIKMTVHYPRIFFVADESDLDSRALVLRGLAVINASVVKQVKGPEKRVTGNRAQESTDTTVVTAVDAQWHSMESYINPGVRGVLGLKPRHSEMLGHSMDPPPSEGAGSLDVKVVSGLGIALIEPVTFGVQISQTRRDLFPSRRSLHVNMDPVSTTISFEDLTLLAAVLERWSMKRPKESQKGKTGTADATESSAEYGQSDSSDNVVFSTATSSLDVIFESRRLGLVLKKVSRAIVVESIAHVSDDLHEVKVGDVLRAVNGEPVKGLSLERVVQHLANAPRPITLTFSRQTFDYSVSNEDIDKRAAEADSKPSSNDESPSNIPATSVFTVTFLMGIPTGLQIEKHLCGDIPVLTDVNADAFACAQSIGKEQEIRIPRAGAVISFLDATPSLQLGYDDSVRALQQFEEQESSLNEGAAAETSLGNLTYSLTFVELESSHWGVVDDVVVSIARLDITFINDVKGRDMPLLRGRMHCLDFHVERGLGLEAYLIETVPPSFFGLGDGHHMGGLGYRVSTVEPIQKVGALARIEIDYYHPRIAAWEPLLEPSQLCLGVEWQEGSVAIPGRLAVEISDKFLHTQRGRYDHLYKIADPVGIICVNITEPATEVIFRTMNDWKEWRRGSSELAVAVEHTQSESEYADEREDFRPRQSSSETDFGQVRTPANGKSDMPLSDSARNAADHSRSARSAVAQKAARAALNFATRRGAGTRKSSEMGTPFVFRNRTGLSVKFNQQLPSGRSEHTEVPEGEETKFHMDTAFHDSLPVANEDAGESTSRKPEKNRVRSYEGQYPSLTVLIQSVAGVLISPLRNLPTFKVGTATRYLHVTDSSLKDDGDNVRPRNYFCVPVVWTVELQDNRRILTLSSAARILFMGSNDAIEIGIGLDAPLQGESIEILATKASEVCSDESIAMELRSVPSATVDSRVSAVRRIGVAEPGYPFFLPLWSMLGRERSYIFVRPFIEASGLAYQWSCRDILAFGPVAAARLTGRSSQKTIGETWAWNQTFVSPQSISCQPQENAVGAASDSYPAWLSCYRTAKVTEVSVEPQENDVPTADDSGQFRRRSDGFEPSTFENFCVVIESCLTFRNLLPTNLQWEIAAFEKLAHIRLGGSSVQAQPSDIRLADGQIVDHHRSLTSGDSVDVFACNVLGMDTRMRMRLFSSQDWSLWAHVPVPTNCESTGEPLRDSRVTPIDATGDMNKVSRGIPMARQVNVQIKDGFGVPFTVGFRIVPKVCTTSDGSLAAYGAEIVAHTELWLRNLTSLPLAFGSASHQIHAPMGSEAPGDGRNSDTAFKVAAEAAISEMASVFELGDKGKGFRSQGEDDGAESDLVMLPFQSSDEMYHEAFEYIEIEGSVVNTRWWGSDTYNSWRQEPKNTSINDESWLWVDQSWHIDCTGEAKADDGGWESCRSLRSGNDTFFSGLRTFSPSHSYRRRRWFRRFESRPGPSQGQFLGAINAIHQPIRDNFTRVQNLSERQAKEQGNKQADALGTLDGSISSFVDQGVLHISVRCGDGQWSDPCLIPATGNAHGVVRVLASRWPTLTKTSGVPSRFLCETTEFPTGRHEDLTPRYSTSNLSPELFEICYQVTEVDGDWGEFSRVCLLTPRFVLRNDSGMMSFEVKQTGAGNETATLLKPGDVAPFYWADLRLPELVSLRPHADPSSRSYKWSGGLDIGRLGMTAVRMRLNPFGSNTSSGDSDSAWSEQNVKSVRSLVEIRSGTGGFGMNISFRDESPEGKGSLFRIENMTPFHIWLAQDGVLANPGIREAQRLHGEGLTWDDRHPESEGDCVGPASRTAFALDIPYRQGKYAHRKAATMSELLRVRVALAPLHCREGIETTKLVGLTEIGESVRLNPSKLSAIIGIELGRSMANLRVLGVVTTDGPTRLLRFCLMRKDVSSHNLSRPLAAPQVIDPESSPQSARQKLSKLATKAALEASTMLSTEKLLGEDEARRMAFFGLVEESPYSNQGRLKWSQIDQNNSDRVFSFRASFSGFSCSLVDSSPSEIALITLNNVNTLARWNAKRTTDGSVVISVGWLQVDNHVPNAPFPVAVSPDVDRSDDSVGRQDDPDSPKTSPLLLVGLTVAPKHKSGILCLRSVSVAPRNLAIAVDLAFIVRLQRFLLGLSECASHTRLVGGSPDLDGWSEPIGAQRTPIAFPDIDAIAECMAKASTMGVERRKMYFEGFTILPCNISLSVAPARALTLDQAALEGPETAAVHAAVRKGDLRLGSGKLGVRVGRKNTTALAVVRGVFKSIVVDALLRCNGASLNFSGVFLRNHFSTWPQLRTHLGAHYFTSLRSNLPALLGSLSAIGNPLGLIRGLGDGMSDFVVEPVKGLKRSMQELDPFFVVDGVARGTGSLARHAVGGFADSASMLTETFSKNMAVLTLDRRYAQRRDRGAWVRDPDASISLVGGVESGVSKLVRGILEGLTGVIRAPIRGAEKKGVEGFAKGIGKGLLGLLVKPVIGLSDAATDVMIGVKGAVEGGRSGMVRGVQRHQIRPRRPLYGKDRILRPYEPADAAAAALMLRTRLAGEYYLSHCDMDDRVALLSFKRLLLLDQEGNELLMVKFKHIKSVEVHPLKLEDGTDGWSVVIVLVVPRKNGSEVEVVECQNENLAEDLREKIRQGVSAVASENY